MNLLGALHIKHAVLYDLDGTKTGGQKVKQDEIAALIHRSRNPSTSRNRFDSWQFGIVSRHRD